MKHDELTSVINDLRPAAVDELADAAFERRPDPDAVRARAAASVPDPRPVRKRRPVRWPALAAGATAVAAAAAVLATGPLSGGQDRHGTGRDVAPDTRTFLLASADKTVKAPTTRGTCWYSRTRMWHDVTPVKTGPGAPKSRSKGPTFRAQTASSTESWACTRPGGTGMRFRSRLPLDVKLTFPTRKDEEAWRAAGSPPLDVDGGTTASKPYTTTYDKGSHLVNPYIGSHEIEWKTIANLPATKSGFEGYLRRLWEQDRKGGAHGYTAPADFCEYVFVSAWDLFMAPTTPGTRAALYRILADCPSVHVTGRVKDREGRPGVAVTLQGTDVRLVVDPATAQLLDYEENTGGTAGGDQEAGDYLAFERQGWVNKIGAVPTP